MKYVCTSIVSAPFPHDGLPENMHTWTREWGLEQTTFGGGVTGVSRVLGAFRKYRLQVIAVFPGPILYLMRVLQAFRMFVLRVLLVLPLLLYSSYSQYLQRIPAFSTLVMLLVLAVFWLAVLQYSQYPEYKTQSILQLLIQQQQYTYSECDV